MDNYLKYADCLDTIKSLIKTHLDSIIEDGIMVDIDTSYNSSFFYVHLYIHNEYDRFNATYIEDTKELIDKFNAGIEQLKQAKLNYIENHSKKSKVSTKELNMVFD